MGYVVGANALDHGQLTRGRAHRGPLLEGGARRSCGDSPLRPRFGTNDEDTGTTADLEAIERNATASSRVDTRMFEGAGHGLSGYEAELATALAAWVDTLL